MYKILGSALIAITFSLSGCGGGGGGSSLPAGPVTSTLSFPLQSAYKTNIANGSTVNYTVLATGIPSAPNGCHGTASFANATPVSATFETISGFSVTGTITLNFTDCTPASTAVTGVSYYDSNYNPIGSSISGTEYDVYLTVPSPLPTSVKVGDTAIFGNQNIYTDSTKTTQIATEQTSFVIEPDTATTAIANAITKRYNMSNQLLFTEQNRYRITATGAFTPVSDDVQYSTTSTTNVLYTAK